MMNKLIVLISLVFIAATMQNCGFRPLYGASYKEDSESDLAAVEIVVNKGSYVKNVTQFVPGKINRLDQLFLGYIEDNFNPNAIAADKKYLLKVSLKRSNYASAIQRNTTITRYTVNVNAEYSLQNKVTGKFIEKGNISRYGEYDAVQSDYSTYVSSEDAAVKIAKELSSDLKYRIATAILNEDKVGGEVTK